MIEIRKLLEQLAEFSTPAVSDILDSFGINGGLEGIRPLMPAMKTVGIAYTLQYEEVALGEQAKAGDYIDTVPENSVVVIANKGRTFCTVWGDILTITAQRKGIRGTVIDGCCRDVDGIIALDYPVFSKSAYMKSGKNRVRLVTTQTPVQIANTLIVPGDYIYGDGSGVIVIPQAMVTDVLKKLEKLRSIEQNIIGAVKNGMALSRARELFHYNEFSLQIQEK